MYSLNYCIAELEKLPGVFTQEGSCLLYRGTPIFDGSHWAYNYPFRVACENLLEGSPEFGESMSPAKLKIWVLQTLYLRECKPTPIFFKNGKLRASAHTTLQQAQINCRARKWEFRTPIMQWMQAQITAKWSTLSEETKTTLSRFCDEEGTFSNFDYASVFLADNRTGARFINLTQFKLCNTFVTDRLGPIWVPKNDTVLNTVTINSVTYAFTSLEWSWFTHNYTKCNTCNTWAQKEDLTFGQCENCTSNTPLSLEGYSTRATDKFEAIYSKQSKYSSHLFGIELEYEQKENSSLKETLFLLNKNLKDHAIFKRDGSLANGVEICTRPASANIHLEELQKLYDDPLIWERLEVKASCGMHIHIDRRKMTALSLGKLINFMQKKSNQSFLETIAERTSNTYSVLGTDLSITSMHRGSADKNRYQGINVQNRQTAELRIFKTPTTFASFQKNVEFTSALTSFIQPGNSGIKDTGYGEFLNYVKNNHSTYRALSKFVKETC